MTRRKNGKSARRRRRRLLAEMHDRQGGLCHYCRLPARPGADPDWDAATVEHVVPLAAGGTDDPGNLVMACRSCNVARGRSLQRMWRAAGMMAASYGGTIARTIPDGGLTLC